MPDNSSIKNVETSKVLNLADLVVYQEGQVVSRSLVQNPALTLTLFAFDAGEAISSHSAPGDAMIQVLEGAAKVTIADEVFQLKAGQSIVMPANVPHGVDAPERFTMLLTLVKG